MYGVRIVLLSLELCYCWVAVFLSSPWTGVPASLALPGSPSTEGWDIHSSDLFRHHFQSKDLHIFNSVLSGSNFFPLWSNPNIRLISPRKFIYTTDKKHCFRFSGWWLWQPLIAYDFIQLYGCFLTVVFEKTLEGALDYKEIRPVSPKGNQPWIFIGRTDAEAEAPILWPPDVKSGLIGKDPDAGKNWGQEEKGATEDEMVGWHHQLNGHEFEQIAGDSEGQRRLVCCSPWGHKKLDMTEPLNNNIDD